ncbi:MAG: 1-acyl-sn-glycerol-3-phosphate acyltransferase [Alphaproteobacteria bacterium]|nr:1-acyl-sn-glycerol-3-phosphate acyltransferase [Alphaproteobacteria bacterium]
MKNLFMTIIAYIRLTCYFIVTLLMFITIFPFSWFRINPKYFRKFWWKFYKATINIKVEKEGTLVKHRPLLMITNHTSFIEITALGATINPAFVPKAELRKMPLLGTIMGKAGCMFIERNPRKAKQETAKLAEKLSKEKSPLLIFPEGTTNNGNEIKPFKSAMFNIVEHQLGRKDIKEDEKLYIQPAVYYISNNKSKKSTAKEREFYAYYVKENPSQEESFIQYMIKILKAGKIKIKMKQLDPIDLSQFSDRKELAEHCHKIIENEYKKMIK